MNIHILWISMLSILLSQCNSSKQVKEDSHQFSNSLIHETSPYLLQHAHNPVNWSAWNSETLKRAASEEKLLIISIGYSSCHWCHVMEHESFEDTIVADFMNTHFIPIKVDREERPDVDDVYMTACNLVNGSGGWPLNAIALPDGRPIWAGTYFPKDQWMNVLNQFVKLKNTDYEKLVEAAENLVAGLKSSDQVIEVEESSEFHEENLVSIGNKFLDNIDFSNGGRKGNQKFPLPNHYEFLLKYAYAYPSSDALKGVDLTLQRMASGGIYDQVEGGFSRYTVDNIWKVPHFEKMLYDNGQLVSLYSKAYQLNKNERYRDVVFETLNFMKTNWRDPSGGYYSSYDADSEGEEGKFYIWTKEELAKIIPASEFAEFSNYFNINEKGNWEDHNILFLDPDRSVESQSFREKKKSWKQLILNERKKRIYPGLDDKILCSWNSLLLNGYIEAYKAFGEESFREEAISIWEFIEKNLLIDGRRLNRNYKNGTSTINAFLDDYSITIKGLIHLYEITFDEKYLLQAEKLTEYVIDHFKNDKATMFNFTSDLDSPLVVEKIELTDGVIPSSNSIMARNLYTLGLFLYKKEYINISKQMLRNMQETIESTSQPNFYSNWCNLYFDMIHEPYEVAILGPGYDQLRVTMMAEYHPNAIYLGGAKEGSLKLLEDKLQEGENFVYVCVNKACKLPVQSAADALKLLD